MAARRKPSPLMGAATAMLDGVSGEILREDSRFRHSMEIATDRIRPDPNQPRTEIDTDELARLAQTMAEQGQLQPMLVRRDPETRGHWIIVAGERRWRAARANSWPSVLAIEHAGDAEVAMLIENLQRVDLTILEEARGLQRLIEGKGWSQAQAAQLLGKSEAEVSSTLRVLSLPGDLLSDLLATKDGMPARYVLAELARLEPGAARDRLIRAAREGVLTQRMVRAARMPASASEPEPKRPARSGRRLSAAAIHKFSLSIRRLAKVSRQISDDERASLQQLRDEIDDLLKQETAMERG